MTFDVRSYAIGKASVPLEELTITENGTYTPETEGGGFSSVTAEVENSFTASDEGKVVVVTSPAGIYQLSAQTPYPNVVTSGGTYNTTTHNSITFAEPTGTLNITENGSYGVSDYGRVDVNVPAPQPTGTLAISANGTYDVGSYASAAVNVPTSAPSEYVEHIYDNNSNLIEVIVHSNVANPYYYYYKIPTLTTAIITGSSTKIPAEAFYWCSYLTSVTFPNNLTEIGNTAFRDTGLQNVTLPNTLTTIGQNAFQGCQYAFTNLIIPDSVTNLGSGAFNGCAYMSSVTLGSGLTELPMNIFMYCNNITSLTIPANITTVGMWSIREMRGLTSLYFEGTPTTFANNAIYACPNLTDIYVPWAEGAVANAPWGATNATIHYNWTPSA